MSDSLPQPSAQASKPTWGILSTAKIGVEKVIPALLKSPHLQVAAIASRDGATAQRVADDLGIPKAYDSYEALLADPSIDIIYNPLPNHLHVPWTLAAARAGKHVLCEKPFALNAAELEVLRPYAKQVHIAEAFMVCHHPQWLSARQAIQDGQIGDLRYINVFFSFFNDNPQNIRNQSSTGGGALYDIGCYAVMAGRWFFATEPKRVSANLYFDTEFATDTHSAGLLDFGQGRHLAFSVSTQAALCQRIFLVGSKGHIQIEIPFNAPADATSRYFVAQQSLHQEDAQTVTLAPCDQYQLQGEAFTKMVQTEAPSDSGLADAAASMRVLDALYRSEKTGKREPVIDAAS